MGTHFRRRSVLVALVSGALIPTAACIDQGAGVIDNSQQVEMSHGLPGTVRLATPDVNFRLTPEQRASVQDGFDVDALERLLAAVEPEVRPVLLADFGRRDEAGPDTRVFVSAPTRMGDPLLQPLLDEVWAPLWDRLPPDALDNERLVYPGKELARQRRALRGVQ